VQKEERKKERGNGTERGNGRERKGKEREGGEGEGIFFGLRSQAFPGVKLAAPFIFSFFRVCLPSCSVRLSSE